MVPRHTADGDNRAVTLDCLAFARQGAGSLPSVKTIEPLVELNGAAPRAHAGTPVVV